MTKIRPDRYDLDKVKADMADNIVNLISVVVLTLIGIIILYFAIYGAVVRTQIEYWEQAHKANFFATMHKYNKFQSCLEYQDTCLCAYNLPEYERKCYCDEQETH